MAEAQTQTVSYNCPACGGQDTLRIFSASEIASNLAQQLGMGRPRQMRCSNCNKGGPLLPGISDELALLLFARAWADDYGLGMQRGKRYRILHKSSTQKFNRESVMDFLGRDEAHYAGRVELNFSARPLAGTQTMPCDWIVSVTEVPSSTPVCINRRAK